MSYETEYRDMTDETADIARLKTFVALGFDILFMMIAIVFISVGYVYLAAAVGFVAIVGCIVTVGRDNPGVRRYAELIPGIEYTFPPLDDYKYDIESE